MERFINRVLKYSVASINQTELKTNSLCSLYFLVTHFTLFKRVLLFSLRPLCPVFYNIFPIFNAKPLLKMHRILKSKCVRKIDSVAFKNWHKMIFRHQKISAAERNFAQGIHNRGSVLISSGGAVSFHLSKIVSQIKQSPSTSPRPKRIANVGVFLFKSALLLS